MKKSAIYYKLSAVILLTAMLVTAAGYGNDSTGDQTENTSAQNTETEAVTEAVTTSYYETLGEMNCDGKVLSMIGADYATRRN
nr:hypothetical protein [Clostridia bacterium]